MENTMQLFSTPVGLSSHLLKLHKEREAKKKKVKRHYRLTAAERKAILEKTNCKCHVCGGHVSLKDFHADHVEPHSSSANNKIDNFLPACATCNHYRWYYDPEEIRWILKLGIFFRTQIEQSSRIGKLAAEKFIRHEFNREKRNK